MRYFQFVTDTDKKLGKYLGKRSKDDEGSEFDQDSDEWSSRYKEKIRVTNEALAEKSFMHDIFINFSSVTMKKTEFAVATDKNEEMMPDIEAHFQKYLVMHNFEYTTLRIEEISTNKYRNLIKHAQRNDYIDDKFDLDEECERYGLSKARSTYYSRSFYDESMLIDREFVLKDFLKQKNILSAIPDMKNEVERIFKTPRDRWLPGIPVHYVISTDEGIDNEEYLTYLLNALLSCKRIVSRRIILIDYEKLCDRYCPDDIRELFRLQAGGAMVLKVRKDTLEDSSYLTGSESRADDICRLVMEWKNKVQVIFQFPRDSEKLQDAFFSELDGVSLIKIKETLLFDQDAKDFLLVLAKENMVMSYAGLRPLVEKNTGYSKRDLRKLFDQWHTIYMKEKVFPQYANEAVVMSQVEKGPRGSGIERLNNLIGLTETKSLISNILDFAKAQALYAEDPKQTKQALHMIFSGNPGTAKTTVARLVAQILKENKILDTGDLIEVGRADLVGKYVGWTAPTVKSLFKKAAGSVLFIDEAYSLVDDRDGCYGDEAITTIVQEMENHRDDVVVIFAGYTDKMEGFLKKNPGLRSRIGFHVTFPDYSADELFQIMELLSDSYGVRLAEDVRTEVYPIIEKAAGVPEFGNGRYVRNLLERARMRQATRLVRMDQKKITGNIAATLIADDFEEIHLSAAIPDKKIGFI